MASTGPWNSSNTAIICASPGGVAVNHVVGQNHRKGFLADERPRDEQPEAEWLALANVGEADRARNPANFGELFLLASRFEERLELDRDVEVVLDRVLAAAGDEDDVVDAGGDRLDSALDNRSACRPAAAFPWAAPW